MAWGIGLALPVAVVAPRAAALVAILAVVADVGQQRDLAGPLDRRRDLVLVPAAGAGDPARADLSAVGDVLLQGRDVLLVELVDLVAAVGPGLAAGGNRGRPSCHAGASAGCAASPLWKEPRSKKSVTRVWALAPRGAEGQQCRRSRPEPSGTPGADPAGRVGRAVRTGRPAGPARSAGLERDVVVRRRAVAVGGRGARGLE